MRLKPASHLVLVCQLKQTVKAKADAMLNFNINKAEVWTASYCAQNEIYKFIFLRLVLAWWASLT